MIKRIFKNTSKGFLKLYKNYNKTRRNKQTCRTNTYMYILQYVQYMYMYMSTVCTCTYVHACVQYVHVHMYMYMSTVCTCTYVHVCV